MTLRYFSDKELQCKCCNKLPDSYRTWAVRLDTLRDLYGKPITISSGYRCPDYNSSISSTGDNGPHTKCAVDIPCSGSNFHKLLEIGLFMGYKGIGIKQNGPHSKRFIHFDDVDRKVDHIVIWSYP